jgi:CheY-like chemotaxis protein
VNTQLPIEWNTSPAEPISILVVDDNAALGEMTAVIARTLFGARVTVFDSPQRALEAFRIAPSSWDMVLTDFHMPGMTRHALAVQLRALRPALAVVLMSGEAMAEEVCGELAQPVQFVRKPFFVRELSAAIRVVASCRECALAA